MNMTKKLNLRELLNFYDFMVESSVTHASAINAVLGEDLAVSLLTDYFTNNGYEVLDILKPCTLGTQKGPRLDRWFVIKKNNVTTFFQVEIKNWSAHSVGGRAVDKQQIENSKYMSDFRIERWTYQFNTEKKVPSQKETLKVLTRMRWAENNNRANCYTYNGDSHKALLCFWEPLHDDGKLEALFEVDVCSESFNKLTIFSMSNYVTQLLKTKETLDVEMKNADARINWLKKIYH
jgi:hypothetical protein